MVLAPLGVVVAPPKLDLAAMMKHKDDTVAANVNGVAFLFKKNKIDWVSGEGRIAAPGRVIVKGADGKETDARDQGDRHRHWLRRRAAAGRRDRREDDRLLDRRVEPGRAAEEADRRRRRRHRTRTRLGLAPAGFRGDGGRVSRPRPDGNRRRGRQVHAAHAGKAGLRLSPWPQAGQGRDGRSGRQGDDRAFGGRRGQDARRRRRARLGRTAPVSPKASGWRRLGSRRSAARSSSTRIS